MVKVKVENYPNERIGWNRRASLQADWRKGGSIIDEYDAPLLDVVHEKDELKQLRLIMQNFYSPLKKTRPISGVHFHHGNY